MAASWIITQNHSSGKKAIMRNGLEAFMGFSAGSAGRSVDALVWYRRAYRLS
jgi:hypothetical protein